MADIPHITISHHPHAGVIAAPSHDHHVTDHLLRRVGFEPVPDSRLYTLTEPGRDPVRRTQLAVQSLRAARQNVTADAAYDLPSPHSAREREDRLESATVVARSVEADVRAGRIAVHEQLRDPEGTLRAVGTDRRTGEGVLLYGEGDQRYVETRTANAALAEDAFSYIRGNGRPAPAPDALQRRAQAATASPARARSAARPRPPSPEPASRPAPNPPRQPARSR